MESRILEYVMRVAELGSINKAATDLQISQPSLSRHVSSLEAELGVQLFTRTQGGVQLTDAGRLLTERGRPSCTSSRSSRSKWESLPPASLPSVCHRRGTRYSRCHSLHGSRRSRRVSSSVSTRR